MINQLRRYRYAVLLIASLLLLAASGRILTFVAGLLVCDQQLQRVDAIAIVSGDRRFDFAARSLAEGRAQRILLFEDRFRWAVHFGALPPEHENSRKQLIGRDLPTEQIELLAGPTANHRDRAARLATWLGEHSEGSVLLVCDRFDSQKVRRIVDRIMPISASSRVTIAGLADRRFDETNWWKSRTGIKSFLQATLTFMHSSLVDVSHPVAGSSWDPVEYERQLSLEMDKAP